MLRALWSYKKFMLIAFLLPGKRMFFGILYVIKLVSCVRPPPPLRNMMPRVFEGTGTLC